MQNLFIKHQIHQLQQKLIEQIQSVDQQIVNQGLLEKFDHELHGELTVEKQLLNNEFLIILNNEKKDLIAQQQYLTYLENQAREITVESVKQLVSQQHRQLSEQQEKITQ